MYNFPTLCDIIKTSEIFIDIQNESVKKFIHTSSMTIAKMCLFSEKLISNEFKFAELAGMILILSFKVLEKLKKRYLSRNVIHSQIMIIWKLFELNRDTISLQLVKLNNFIQNFGESFPKIKNLEKNYNKSFINKE